MTVSAVDRKSRPLCLLSLLMFLGFLATACGGTNTVQANQVEPVDRADLVNPAEYGEEALAKVPEINPPLEVGDPRIVGSQDMTRFEFVQVVVEDLNAMWQASFESGGLVYLPAPVILYDEPMAISGCGGVADPQIGPFYCPDNMTVYYPVSFTDRSGQRPGQIGDFALANVLAHEIGHHVQNQLGTLDVGLFTIQEELQADCFAGVWGRSIYEQGSLEEGDLGEAVELIANVADLPGTPWDDPSAHGTESQRIDAFFTGYDTGRPRQCKF